MDGDKSSGQTLIALLIFMMLAITLTLSATLIMVVHMQGDVAYQTGEQALHNAQTGMENALLRLERNTTYSGETLTLGNGTATISVSGSGTKTIVSTGTSGSAVRTVTATASITNTVVSLTNWSETP